MNTISYGIKIHHSAIAVIHASNSSVQFSFCEASAVVHPPPQKTRGPLLNQPSLEALAAVCQLRQSSQQGRTITPTIDMERVSCPSSRQPMYIVHGRHPWSAPSARPVKMGCLIENSHSPQIGLAPLLANPRSHALSPHPLPERQRFLSMLALFAPPPSPSLVAVPPPARYHAYGGRYQRRLLLLPHPSEPKSPSGRAPPPPSLAPPWGGRREGAAGAGAARKKVTGGGVGDEALLWRRHRGGKLAALPPHRHPG